MIQMLIKNSVSKCDINQCHKEWCQCVHGKRGVHVSGESEHVQHTHTYAGSFQSTAGIQHGHTPNGCTQASAALRLPVSAPTKSALNNDSHIDLLVSSSSCNLNNIVNDTFFIVNAIVTLSSETPMWVTCSLNGTPISLELQ